MTTPVEGMNKIDAAIAELLGPLGEGWAVISIKTTTFSFQPFGENTYNMITGYKATISNGQLSAEGEGQTVGDAIAMAFVAVQKQALRSRA